MVNETRVQTDIMVGCSDIAALFRVPAGLYWQGKRNTDGTITSARAVRVVVKGYSDLTGWRRSDGKFVAIEVKTNRGRASKEQLHFIEQVKQAGGLAGIARSVEQARNIILGGETDE